ncbi:MAG: hypothetical protein SNG34_06960 [Rikenellaceae bacterium]
MNRGKLTIEHKSDGTLALLIELVDGDVWLARCEIVDILGIHTQSVIANLREIYKSKELYEETTVRESNNVRYYNLDVIIALAFRCKGGYCRPIREWIRERIKRPLVDSRQPIIITLNGTGGRSLS